MAGQVFAGVGITHRDQINGHAVCSHGGTQRGKALGYGIHAHNDSFLFSMAGPPEKPPAAGNFSVSYCIIPGKRLQCRGGTVWNDLRLPGSILALSVSHSLDSSPKVGAFGSPCKVYHYAKASPFGRGVTVGDGEGEPAEEENIFRLFPENATFLQKKLQFFLEKGRFPIDSLVIIGV